MEKKEKIKRDTRMRSMRSTQIFYSSIFTLLNVKKIVIIQKIFLIYYFGFSDSECLKSTTFGNVVNKNIKYREAISFLFSKESEKK